MIPLSLRRALATSLWTAGIAVGIGTAFPSRGGFAVPTAIGATQVPLTSSDVSILVPLKANAAPDDVLNAAGTGLCNALPFSGATSPEPIVRSDQFDALTRLIFARGQDGSCNSAGEGGSGGDDATVLLKRPAEHLARIRGLPGRACRYDAWRIVGVRVDPCAGRVGKKFETANDLKSCVPTFRAIAQPFSTQPSIFPDDLALHLIYSVADLGALVGDLRQFAAVTAAATTGSSRDASERDSRMLRPHPGLRVEMNTCNGPVSAGFRTLVSKYARASKLVGTAFMSSSTVQMQWTFGMTTPQNGKFVLEPGIAGEGFYNFSGQEFEFGSAVPFNNGLMSATFPTAAKLYATDLLMNSAPLTEDQKKKASSLSGVLAKLQNPVAISPVGSDCVSCHIAPQAATQLRNLGVTIGTAGGYIDVPVWPAFASDRRSSFNFRNFGYGPGFEWGVSRRVINETDDVRRTLNTVFGK